ncbi:UDP-glucosyltransferase 2-like [Aricia agestis]|uniref:UDP-glucosyltransferase 2-like n=1 Tax=Aricia agestis TaxID=91739 RepID=UPI001C2067CF|nr:UDP-glucosyltransferase 2-like [Aricia agestis]
MKLILLVLSVLFGVNNGYRILCLLPYPGKSHHMVFEPLLQELLNRGHHLTIVSFFPQPSRENRRDVSLVGLAPLAVESIDLRSLETSYTIKYFNHIPLVTHLAKSNLKLCETVLNSPVFQEFIAGKGDYDVILVEHFNSDCMLGVIHNYGVPSVGLMSSALLPWSHSRVGASDNPSYVPGMTLPFTDQMSFYERTVNTFILFFYIYWYEIEIRWKEQKLLEGKFGRLPPLEEIAKNTSVVLVNTHYSWNGVRILPPSVVEVGGLHLHNRTINRLPPELHQFAQESSEYGFIVMSFGSLVKGSTLPQKQLQAIINVFARLPQRIVMKWETDIQNLPKNVMIVRWLPQFDLLNHPNCVAFITHGGLLSLTEAVCAGVPVLAMPILGDQFGNAAHAHKAGIGEVMELLEVEEKEFDIKLKTVLSAETRLQAKLVSDMWKDRPSSPMDTAIFHIERVAKYKGLDMSSEARRLNRIQLALLDVYAFYLLVLMCFVTWLLFRKSGLVSNKKKIK